MSELFELRKLTCPQSQTVPPTDFFEYYWAYQADGTKFVHVLTWAWALLARRPKNVPHQLKFLWFTLWTLIVTIALLLSSRWWNNLATVGANVIKSNYLLAVISSALLLLISLVVMNYVGDAARYLDPSPANIDMRHRIRKEGIALLRRLHDCKQYDRIVLVGHSLGSVIACDIIRNLWPEYNTVYDVSTHADQSALKKLESTGEFLASYEDRDSELQQRFREDQTALWVEQRRLGNPWLVTDLITVGSPLAHAELLLARDRAELRARQIERELPTCPPVLDDGSYAYPIKLDGENRTLTTLNALHHGAVFACTRWTNLYFPAALGFFGDLVGGPMREIFGYGVRDIAVTSAEWGGIVNASSTHPHALLESVKHQCSRHESKCWSP